MRDAAAVDVGRAVVVVAAFVRGVRVEPTGEGVVMRASCRSGSRVECIDDHGRCYFVTARQLPVLLSLANDSRTVRTIAYDWPGMNDGMARSIVAALYRKGLVEPDRFESDGRSWKPSDDGYDFVDAIEKVGWADEDDES